MIQSHLTNLVDRMMEFTKEGPFFFYDLTRHFGKEEYRDLLAAWGTVRSSVKFDRDEDGRYVWTGKPSK